MVLPAPACRVSVLYGLPETVGKLTYTGAPQNSGRRLQPCYESRVINQPCAGSAAPFAEDIILLSPKVER